MAWINKLEIDAELRGAVFTVALAMFRDVNNLTHTSSMLHWLDACAPLVGLPARPEGWGEHDAA